MIVPDKSRSSVGDGAFEFERTVSRLHKMQSESYRAASTYRKSERQRPAKHGMAN